MSEDPKREITPRNDGLFRELVNRLKLILRLMGDRRVNPLLKLLPIGSVLYLLIPSLIPPDFIPGPVDDVAILWFGATLFIELCPPEIVQEHRQALNSIVDVDWREADDEG